jgi:hypothetical protein
MDEEGIPGMGTYSVPGFGGDMPPMRRKFGTGNLTEPG